MKLLVIAHESEFVGGANRALFAILKYWKDNNIDIKFDVLLPCNHGRCIDELVNLNIKYYVVKYYKVFTELKSDYKDILRKINVYRKYVYNIYAANKISKKLIGNNYDAVYSNTRMTSMGEYIAEFLHIPHVIHIREFGNENTYWGPFDLKNIYKKSCKIILISYALSEYVKKYISEDRLVISHDGVVYKGTLKLNNHIGFNLLLTGRITSVKSQKEAILALAELKKRGISNNIFLHFAGSVSQNSKYAKQYYDLIVKLICEYNLEKQVVFHGEVKDMEKLRQDMDVELMCAERETFGWVTVEGMRSGLLVIGANTGATPEIISDMKTGILYRQGNAIDLADKIEWIIRNPEEAEIIRKNGKKFSDEHFTIKNNALEIYNTLKECIQG